MPEDFKYVDDKKRKQRRVDIFIGMGASIGMAVLWSIFLGLSGAFLNNYYDSAIVQYFIVFLGIGLIVFTLFSLWYPIKRKRKFIILGMLIGLIGIPLLLFGGCIMFI